MSRTCLRLCIIAFGIAAILSAIGILLALRYWSPLPTERLIRARNHAFLKQVRYSIADFYNKTGILLRSQRDFCKSSVYPFRDDLSVLTGSSVKVETDTIGNQVRINIISDKVSIFAVSIKQLTPEEITRKRIEFICSGKEHAQSFVNTLRGELLEYAPRTNQPFLRSPTPQAAKFSSALPKSQTELRRYLSWLTKLIGSEILIDGFGSPLDIKIRSGQVHIRSSGRDGKYGTADDIVAGCSKCLKDLGILE